MASPECAFGFRVACATLTVGIVAFLKQSQLFFQEQRLVWAMIIVAIGMSMTSGQVRVIKLSSLVPSLDILGTWIINLVSICTNLLTRAYSGSLDEWPELRWLWSYHL